MLFRRRGLITMQVSTHSSLQILYNFTKHSTLFLICVLPIINTQQYHSYRNNQSLHDFDLPSLLKCVKDDHKLVKLFDNLFTHEKKDHLTYVGNLIYNTNTPCGILRGCVLEECLNYYYANKRLLADNVIAIINEKIPIISKLQADITIKKHNLSECSRNKIVQEQGLTVFAEQLKEFLMSEVVGKNCEIALLGTKLTNPKYLISGLYNLGAKNETKFIIDISSDNCITEFKSHKYDIGIYILLPLMYRVMQCSTSNIVTLHDHRKRLIWIVTVDQELHNLSVKYILAMADYNGRRVNKSVVNGVAKKIYIYMKTHENLYKVQPYK